MTLSRSALAWFAFSLAGVVSAGLGRCRRAHLSVDQRSTAAALLGGDVETHVLLGKAEDGSCRFVRYAQHKQDDQHAQHDQDAQHDQTTVGELDITVARMKDPAREFATYTARCRGEKTPLRGIGNEAYACDLASGTGIVGRVRGAAFLLLLAQKRLMALPCGLIYPVRPSRLPGTCFRRALGPLRPRIVSGGKGRVARYGDF